MNTKRKIGLAVRNILLDLSQWVDTHTAEPFKIEDFPSLQLTDEEAEAFFAAIGDRSNRNTPYVPHYDDTVEHIVACNKGEYIGMCRYGDDMYGDGCPTLTDEQNSARREEVWDEGAIEG